MTISSTSHVVGKFFHRHSNNRNAITQCKELFTLSLRPQHRLAKNLHYFVFLFFSGYCKLWLYSRSPFAVANYDENINQRPVGQWGSRWITNEQVFM